MSKEHAGPNRVARAIEGFVDHPVTILVKGLILFFIGLSEASKTFYEDLANKQLRVGHGLVLIGFFSILQSLPHLIDGLEAGKRYAELREKKAGPGPDGGQRA
jgi:uncharacterized membrane protein